MFNKKRFFDNVRVFMGPLEQSQVDGMEKFLDGWTMYAGVRKAGINLLASALAQVKRETGGQFQPVKETQFTDDVPTDEQVIRRLDAAYAAGKLPWVSTRYWRDGWFGRGLVQLTHEFNYSGKIRQAVMDQFGSGFDIHAKPAWLLDPDISVFVAIKGMLEGWFTGKGLEDYIDQLDEADPLDKLEYIEARRVVNGKDHAKEIAEDALKFERALRLAEWDGNTHIPAAPVPTQAPPTFPVPLPGNDTATRLRAFPTVGVLSILVAVLVLGIAAFFIFNPS